jgi:hypothetical protein
MAGDDSIIDQAPIQDRDLLQRLSIYFDAVEQRLRLGEGWLIFNAGTRRSRRISGFIQHRLAEQRPPVRYFMLPWRDFAISVEAEFNLAAKVTSSIWTQMVSTDLLVLIGCKPTQRHEIELLDRTLASRRGQKLATILMTPEMPQQLEADLVSVDPDRRYWESIFRGMYETGLVAM